MIPSETKELRVWLSPPQKKQVRIRLGEALGERTSIIHLWTDYRTWDHQQYDPLLGGRLTTSGEQSQTGRLFAPPD